MWHTLEPLQEELLHSHTSEQVEREVGEGWGLLMKWVWSPAPHTLIGPSRCRWEQSTVALQNRCFRFVMTGDCNENILATHYTNKNTCSPVYSIRLYNYNLYTLL